MLIINFCILFVDFIHKIEEIKIKENGSEISPLNLLVKTYKDAEDVKQFITAVVYEYEVKLMMLYVDYNVESF